MTPLQERWNTLIPEYPHIQKIYQNGPSSHSTLLERRFHRLVKKMAAPCPREELAQKVDRIQTHIQEHPSRSQLETELTTFLPKFIHYDLDTGMARLRYLLPLTHRHLSIIQQIIPLLNNIGVQIDFELFSRCDTQKFTEKAKELLNKGCKDSEVYNEILRHPNFDHYFQNLEILSHLNVLNAETVRGLALHLNPTALVQAYQTLRNGNLLTRYVSHVNDHPNPTQLAAVLIESPDKVDESIIKHALPFDLLKGIRLLNEADIRQTRRLKAHANPLKLAKGLVLIKQKGALTKEYVKMIESHPNPYQLALGLDGLHQLQILKQPYIDLLRANSNPYVLVEAYVTMMQHEFFQEEYTRYLSKSSDPKSVASAYIFLNNQNLLNKANAKAVANHSSPVDCAEAIQKIAEKPLLAPYREKIIAHASPIKMAKSLSYLKKPKRLDRYAESLARSCSPLSMAIAIVSLKRNINEEILHKLEGLPYPYVYLRVKKLLKAVDLCNEETEEVIQQREDLPELLTALEHLQGTLAPLHRNKRFTQENVLSLIRGSFPGMMAIFMRNNRNINLLLEKESM